MTTVLLDPGMLTARLTLEEPVETPDGQGGTSRRFVTVTALWAHVEPVSAKREEVAGAHVQRATHRVTLRYRERLKPGMRFRRHERVFRIVTVTDPDETRRYLVCRCEEVTA
jgi:SPP1 family predicted phage head-tail adaptor